MMTSVSRPKSLMLHRGREVVAGDSKVGDVEQILAAVGVGIEVLDPVVAEAGCEHEGVVAVSAVHDIVAGAAIQRVITPAARQAIVAGFAIESVGFARAVQPVVAAGAVDGVAYIAVSRSDGDVALYHVLRTRRTDDRVIATVGIEDNAMGRRQP